MFLCRTSWILIQSYIRLESGRVSEDFTVSVVVEEGLDAKSIMIPSMIVQIPVENAIKHGLAGKDDEKELTIRISREGKGVRIVICDNGRGYLPQVASSTRGTGTGLKCSIKRYSYSIQRIKMRRYVSI